MQVPTAVHICRIVLWFPSCREADSIPLAGSTEAEPKDHTEILSGSVAGWPEALVYVTFVTIVLALGSMYVTVVKVALDAVCSALVTSRASIKRCSALNTHDRTSSTAGCRLTPPKDLREQPRLRRRLP